MKLGLQIPDFTWPNGPAKLGAELAGVARAADEAGFEYLAVMDHFFQIPAVGPVENDMLEAYTTLGYLAAHTERVKLLTVITGVIYRLPGVLGKAVTTLDVLSGGRAMLGIGAGWNEEESRGLGFPFPSTKERFDMLEEALRYLHQLFSDDDGPFEGDYISAERMMNVPAPLTKPRPPIMIGGSGEKKTLRFVAKYGDACNIFNSPELERKLDVLRGHCEAEGRNYDEITKTVYHRLDIGSKGEKSEEFLTELRRLSALGVDAVIGSCPTVPDTKPFEIFANEIIPEAAKL
ncbi:MULTISPECIES: LLM class F420-dependent oxidoreductase [Amycolatopsis]|uniref:LLM class F420-dependent oxidoreductase n=2 Tax=Amycolatopsis TaxID=1813 RepID=A0ABP9R8P9_9PSEU|nr:LLM class F420-dependent oxidoreductase [Amycolatopsis sacchari]SFJ17321.1 probable F420-dependent oxidoreductase, Rv1855c family [Amycolatopsis sacchari]